MPLNCGAREDSWESLGLQGDQTSQCKGNQSWRLIRKTDAEAEPSILWPTDAILFIGEDPDAGKVWRQDEKGTTEDEMVRWHHWLDGREIEQALGVGDGQGSPVCFSPWGLKESDTTEQLNWTERESYHRAFISSFWVRLNVHSRVTLTSVQFLLPQVHLFISSLSFPSLAYISQYRWGYMFCHFAGKMKEFF